VKVKLWLDNEANPQKGGVTRQQLTAWYNQFPFNDTYSQVKLEDLRLKPLRMARTSTKAAPATADAFGSIQEGMDESGSDGDDTA